MEQNNQQVPKKKGSIIPSIIGGMFFCFGLVSTLNDIAYAAHTSYCTRKSFMENYSKFKGNYEYYAVVCLQDYEGEEM